MKLTFVSKQQEATDVWTFVFDPVEPVVWEAGQSIRFELPRPTYGTDERRFTISSAPYEKQIKITTRLSDSSFKKSLDALTPGQQVDAFNVEGTFVWGEAMQPRIFVAGGIGITPFHSLLQQRMHEKHPLNATLLYRSSMADAPFGGWLDDLQETRTDFAVQYYVQKRITAQDVAALPHWRDSLVYVSGPTQMVESLSTELLTLGLLEENLKRDLFTGNIS